MKLSENKGLKHWEADHKIPFSGSCFYGNHNSFFVFSMTDISAGGQAIVLKFWKCVLLNQRLIHVQNIDSWEL